jgi:predicted dehydrogenase
MNIGFIGCGNIAHFHADVLKALGVSIIAVSAREHSPNIGLFSEKYVIRKQYTRWQEMLENESLDALWVVATWNKMEEMLIPLIETGLPLFLEKPIALSSSIIKKAIAVHKRTQQYIQIGFNRRFYPFMGEIKTILEKGELRSVLVEIPESIDLNNHDFAKNLWMINSSHILDLLMYFVGTLEIKYACPSIKGNNKILSSYNALLETNQSIPVHLSAEWNTANNFGITFFIDNQRITLKPLEIATIYDGVDVVEPTSDLPVRQYKPKKILEYFCVGKHKPGFYEQADYFINTLKNYTYTDEVKSATLKSSYEITRLIERILHK